MLQSIRLQRVGHDWAIEQEQQHPVGSVSLENQTKHKRDALLCVC